uniref:Uncharacterized protein n=1 Tax=viral metagenome TaxID=1070528 RepID=A0A6H1ZI71_9ZZZZ
MATEAPIPTGQIGVTDGAADAAGEAPEAQKTFTQQQVEAIVASRLRNQKKAEAELKAKMADLERRLSTLKDDDDEDAPLLSPASSAVAAPAKPEQGDRWKRKLDRIRADFEVERQEMLAKLSQADKSHNLTRIQHSLMAELSKRGTVRDVQSVMQLTGGEFDVVDGQVVPKGEDASTVSEFYDKWLASHPVFVSAPPAGGGERPGKLPALGKKRVADMTEAEAHHHAVGRLFGQTRNK